MTLPIAAMSITGLEEQLVRDNVANPETQLGIRALAQITQPYKQATLQRAEAAYQAAFTADASAALPNYLDKAAVIQWYITSPDYRDATQRENAVRVATIDREIESLTREKAGQETKLAAEQDIKTASALAAMIEALTAKIDALNAEKGELI